MNFVSWLAGIIATATAERVYALLRDYQEKQTKLSALEAEAKDLLGELENAQSEAERKAILRKISNFSDFRRML